MSYLSRTLKKQDRFLKSLESASFITITGFDLPKVVVFPDWNITPDNVRECSMVYQAQVDSSNYEDIRDFDSIHTADIEFAYLYNGRFIKKYFTRTKRQLCRLGTIWRRRITAEHPDVNVWIVVHFNEEYGWFLDTFNWNIQENWKVKPAYTIWL